MPEAWVLTAGRQDSGRRHLARRCATSPACSSNRRERQWRHDGDCPSDAQPKRDRREASRPCVALECLSLHGAMRGQRALDCHAGRVRFWNTAVRNSSALRVALTRLSMDEMAQAMSKEMVSIHWDMEKLHDSVSPLLAMEEMLASGFDPVFLDHQHAIPPGAKSLETGHHSQPMAATSSILAGMNESGMYTRSCLVALLEEVYSKIPAVAIQDYVGDLAQQVEHKVAFVAAEHVCDGSRSHRKIIDNETPSSMELLTASTAEYIFERALPVFVNA